MAQIWHTPQYQRQSQLPQKQQQQKQRVTQLPGENGFHARDGSLTKKKREQWEREKAESEHSSWFPFGGRQPSTGVRGKGAAGAQEERGGKQAQKKQQEQQQQQQQQSSSFSSLLNCSNPPTAAGIFSSPDTPLEESNWLVKQQGKRESCSKTEFHNRNSPNQTEKNMAERMHGITSPEAIHQTIHFPPHQQIHVHGALAERTFVYSHNSPHAFDFSARQAAQNNGVSPSIHNCVSSVPPPSLLHPPLPSPQQQQPTTTMLPLFIDYSPTQHIQNGGHQPVAAAAAAVRIPQAPQQLFPLPTGFIPVPAAAAYPHPMPITFTGPATTFLEPIFLPQKMSASVLPTPPFSATSSTDSANSPPKDTSQGFATTVVDDFVSMSESTLVADSEEQPTVLNSSCFPNARHSHSQSFCVQEELDKQVAERRFAELAEAERRMVEQKALEREEQLLLARELEQREAEEKKRAQKFKFRDQCEQACLSVLERAQKEAEALKRAKLYRHILLDGEADLATVKQMLRIDDDLMAVDVLKQLRDLELQKRVAPTNNSPKQNATSPSTTTTKSSKQQPSPHSSSFSSAPRTTTKDTLGVIEVRKQQQQKTSPQAMQPHFARSNSWSVKQTRTIPSLSHLPVPVRQKQQQQKTPPVSDKTTTTAYSSPLAELSTSSSFSPGNPVKNRTMTCEGKSSSNSSPNSINNQKNTTPSQNGLFEQLTLRRPRQHQQQLAGHQQPTSFQDGALKNKNCAVQFSKSNETTRMEIGLQKEDIEMLPNDDDHFAENFALGKTTCNDSSNSITAKNNNNDKFICEINNNNNGNIVKSLISSQQQIAGCSKQSSVNLHNKNGANTTLHGGGEAVAEFKSSNQQQHSFNVPMYSRNNATATTTTGNNSSSSSTQANSPGSCCSSSVSVESANVFKIRTLLSSPAGSQEELFFGKTTAAAAENSSNGFNFPPSPSATFARARTASATRKRLGKPVASPFSRKQTATGNELDNKNSSFSALRQNLCSPTMRLLQESLQSLSTTDEENGGGGGTSGTLMDCRSGVQSRSTTPKPFNCQNPHYRSFSMRRESNSSNKSSRSSNKNNSESRSRQVLEHLAVVRAQLKSSQAQLEKTISQQNLMETTNEDGEMKMEVVGGTSKSFGDGVGGNSSNSGVEKDDVFL